MTASRSERKYLVQLNAVSGIRRVFGEHLQSHRPSNMPPPARDAQSLTSIYFDTAERHLFRAAQSGRQSLKLRARVYAPQAFADCPDPLVWLELKAKYDAQVDKTRLPVRRPQVPMLLAFDREEASRLEPDSPAPSERTFCRALMNLQKSLRLPLRPDCVVHYQREAWQSADGGLRLTLDQGVSCFLPPPELWSSAFGLHRDALGQPKATLRKAVLEVKTRGRRPAWLKELLASFFDETKRFSKFAFASSAVRC